MQGWISDVVERPQAFPPEVREVMERAFTPEQVSVLKAVRNGSAGVRAEDPVVHGLVVEGFLAADPQGTVLPATDRTFYIRFLAYRRSFISKEMVPAFDRVLLEICEGPPAARVVTYEFIEKVIASHRWFEAGDCPCRLLVANCDLPVKVCMRFPAVDRDVAATTRKIGRQEAIDIAALCRSRNMIPTTTGATPEDTTYCCFCCDCCCEILRNYKVRGIAAVLERGPVVAVTTEDCAGCGKCVEACRFDARLVVDGLCVVDESRCMGCGVCQDDCEAGAVTFRFRSVATEGTPAPCAP